MTITRGGHSAIGERGEVAPAGLGRRPEAAGSPAQILVAGSDLLAEALASALESYGFATMNIAANAQAFEAGIDWRPDLVLLDARGLDIPCGCALINHLGEAGLQICVIDTDTGDRADAWSRAGISALIDKGAPFDELFRTITAILRRRFLAQTAPRYVTSLELTPRFEHRRERLEPFTSLTDRERVVLAELIEGNCAEDIAKAAFVSISTVRSQIKAILQKLGVSSQLAAVAMARRAGWSFEGSLGTLPESSSNRRRNAS